MDKYILALDQGTSSSRAIVFDGHGRTKAVSQKEFTQIFPKPGWVEHNPMEIWSSQASVIAEAITSIGINGLDIAAIGITNQRETTIVWDAETGEPVYNAIVWQDRRTSEYCDSLKAQGLTDMIRSKTGLIIDAYFSATKVRWILDNVPGARQKAQEGRLRFGTVDTWLLWKLTDGRVFVTDRTNASRTMLCNIRTGEWDEGMLSLLGVPRSMLPEIKSSSEIYGSFECMGSEIVISGIAGDQQAALFGQCCFDRGSAKNTYGTGCFLLTHTGNDAVSSKHGLLTTIAATEAGKPIEYALEGSVFVGGAVVQWLRDELRVINESKDSEYFARKVSDNGGVYVVPAFAGLGAPYWDMHARGSILGLTRGTGANHIIRAALESICYQTEDVLAAMREDMRSLPYSSDVSRLKVDGGASANKLLMQMQADFSDLSVVRSANPEATATGAAYLAGLAVGFFESRDELRALAADADVFEPSIDAETRARLLEGWHRAVNACRNF